MEKMMINLRQRVSFYPVKGIVSLGALFIILSGNTVVAQLRFGDNLGTHKATRGLNMNSHNIDEIGSLRHRVIAITDKDTGGDIGTAAATVDTCSVFSIDQNTANQTLSLPTPKLPTAGRMVYVMNAGSASFSIAGANVKPGDALQLIYNGNTWNVFKGDQQNVSVGAPSGTAYDNGGIVSGNSLSLSYADGTHPGMVSTSAQTFGGDKTFSSDVAVNGGDVTTTATTASVFNTAATTLNVGGAATALNLGASTGTTIVNGNLTLATGKNLIFTGATSGTVTFKPTTVTTSYTLTLPGSQGASTQTVVNDGLGNLSWGYGLINQANYGTNSLMVGSSVGTGVTAVSNSNFLGTSAGSGATNAYGSNFLGTSAGSGATNASYSNFLGPSAGQSATSAFYSNFFGTFAGQGGTTASNSNFFGQSAGYNAAGAKNSNFLGFSAGNGAAGASNSNFFGQYAGYGATNVSNSNFLGISVGYQATSASYSTLLGYNVANEFAGSHIGSNNIVIGTNITLPAATTNGLNIGGVLFGTGTYSTTAGDPVATAVSSGKIGIGVVTPTARLQLPAGGSAAGLAPLKLTAGINLGTTEAGAIEYDGAHLYFSATNGGTRSQLDQQGISLGAPSGTTYTNGGIVTGGSLSLSYADGTNPGMVSTAAQTIAGVKTFSSDITTTGDVAVNGGDVTTTATTATVFNTAATTLNMGGAATALNLGGTTGTTTVNNNLTVAANKNFAQSGTGTFATGTGAVSLNGNATLAAGKNLIFTGAASGTVTLQPTTSTTSYTLTLPGSQGASTQTVVNDGLGNLSWGYGLINQANSGTYSVMVGQLAGLGAATVSYSNFFGASAGSGATGATNSNFLGYSAGNGATGATNSNFLGYLTGYKAINASNSTLLGYEVANEVGGSHIGSNNIIIGTNITLPAATANGLNIGGVLFGTGTYSTTAGDPLATAVSSGKIGIGVVTPTARLQLPAGASAAGLAPLKLTAGINLGTTEAGAIEYDGSHLYFSATNGGTRSQLDQQGITLGAPSGTTYANGGVVSGSVLNLSYADGTYPGLVSINPQTFAGAKTFNADITTTGDVAVNGGDVTTTATTATVFNTNATTLNVGGAATVLNLGAASGTTTVNNNLKVVGSTILGTTTATNTAATYSINAATVNSYSGIIINQSSVPATLNIATPTDATAGRIFTVSNNGTYDLMSVYGNICPNTSATFVYNGVSWSSSLAAIGRVNGVNNGYNLMSSAMGAGGGVTDVSFSNFFGVSAGAGATSASYSNFLGGNAGKSATNAAYSNFLGWQAGESASLASYSTLIGYNVANERASFSNIGSNNIIIGTNITLPDATANALNIGGVLFGTGTHASPSGDPTATAVAGGKIGIGVEMPTARLQLPPGASGAGLAPLKLTAGTNLGTTEAGAIEYDGSHLYFSATNGGTRSQLDQQGITLGAPSGTTYANGGVVSGSVLNLSYADGTNPGLVSTAAQTIAGAKTFNADITTTGDVAVNGGDVTTTATTATVFNTNATTLNVGGAATVLNLGAASGTTTVNNNLTLAASKNLIFTGATSGTVTLQPTAATTSYTLTLPGSQGANTQTVVNDGSGNLSWGYGLINNAYYGNNSVMIGNLAGNAALSNVSCNFLGSSAGKGATTNNANFLGPNAGLNASTTGGSNFMGPDAGNGASASAYSNFLGVSAGQSSSGASYSNFFGQAAGMNAGGATYSNFIGSYTGFNAGGATYSNFMGANAGKSALSASNSTLIGYNVANEASGSHIGSNNIVIGTNITLPAATANALNIGGVLFGTGTYATLTGNPTATAVAGGKIGIGVVTPTASLHLPAGGSTAGNAPLKLTAGTNLGTTEAGAIEYDGSHLYFSATNGGTRSQLDQQGITLGAPSGTTYANGGVVSGNSLILSYADGTNPGLISTAAQTIAGAKTFTTNVTTTGDVAVNGGDVTTTATTATVFNTAATTLSVGGAATILNLGASTGTTTVNNNLATTGTATVSGATLNLGTAGTATAGKIVLEDGNTGTYNVTLSAPALVATLNKTITLPDATGTVALVGTVATVTTATYTINTEETILVNYASTATITLPTAVGCAGRKCNVKNIGTGTATVKSAGGTIDGISAATGVSGSSQWQGWTFQSDGTNWYIISRI